VTGLSTDTTGEDEVPGMCFTLRRMRQWRVRLLTVLIVGGVTSAIAACTSSSGGDPTLTPGPPSTTSAPSSPSATPSPTGPATTGPNVRPGEQPPVLISQAKKHNSTGALFFAHYYMQVVDWTIATNSTYLLEKITLSSCQTCRRTISSVDGYAKQGAHATGGRLTIGESKLVHGSWDVKSDYVVDIKFVQGPITIVYKDAPPSVEASAAASQGSYVFVSWVGGAWKIVEEESDS
jgi:uncharacterized protein DUF6318